MEENLTVLHASLSSSPVGLGVQIISFLNHVKVSRGLNTCMYVS